MREKLDERERLFGSNLTGFALWMICVNLGGGLKRDSKRMSSNHPGFQPDRIERDCGG